MADTSIDQAPTATTGDFILMFGKHRGCRLRQVTASYLEFLTGWDISLDGRKVQVDDRVYGDIMMFVGNAECYVQQCSEFPQLANLQIAQIAYYSTLNRMLHEEGPVPSSEVLQRVCRFMRSSGEWNRFETVYGQRFGLTASVYMWAVQFDAVAAARAYVRERRLCFKCFTYMPPIGNMRVNGAPHDDWTQRSLHKTCYRKLVKEYESDD